MDPIQMNAIDSSDTSCFAAFGRRPGVDRPRVDHRVFRVRRSLATKTYENDLKLSIAVDRLLMVIERT